MLDDVEANRVVLAFDTDAIQAGNRGHGIDHAAVSIAVDQLVASMTLDQKIHEIHGMQAQPVDGLYHAGGDDGLGLPPYKMVDGPRGARAGEATAFPVAIARGATFDPELEKRVGEAIGLEVAAKGGNVLLAPTINLLRHPGWGRAQETYSEDPWHMGAMGVAFIAGAQQHVLASPKHFALNNIEMTRFDMSANIDIRSLHEVYLPHFKRCIVESRAASVMSAYNKVNGVYCGEHPILLTDILRGDWGFTGFVESDWFLGARSTAASLNAGMDIEMPAAFRFDREKIDQDMADGNLADDTITRAASHAVYQKIAFNLAELPLPDSSVVESEEHRALAREVAARSFVLLKNESVLPLKTTQKIAVFGELANTVNLGDRGSSMVTSSLVVTPLAGLQAFGNETQIVFVPSLDDAAGQVDADVSIVVAGLTYLEEGEFIPTQQQTSEGGDLARGGDRANLRLPLEQETLIRQVAARSKKTLVLLEAGSAIEVRPWLEDIDGLLMIWYPGCEGGHAIASVLFGETNPCGRLPVVFPRAIDQLMDWDIQALDVTHDLFHGYRYLHQRQEIPEFPFGFGLSYTEFVFDSLQVEKQGSIFFITVTVVNVGLVAGAVVPQLYVAYQDSSVLRVPRELKGFGRASLEPGEKVDVVMQLDEQDICYFDPDDGWTLETCSYVLSVGNSSDELLLTSIWRFDGEQWLPL